VDDERATEQAPDQTGSFLAAPGPAAPVRLSLLGVAGLGRALRLRDELGADYTLDVTPELRAALSAPVHGGTPRRSENQMTSSLRPRDIQNRIRSGESPESVAEVAGTTVEAIMPYVAPVVAEREHVASTAQRASLRRGPGEPPTTPPLNRVLGDAVTAHVRSLGADPEADVAWDAYRRETGRWVLTASYDLAGRNGKATFLYDAPGNYALIDDDDARWLIGDLPVADPEVAPMDDLQEARRRRLAATSANDVPLGGPLGEDVIDMVNDTDAPARPAPAAEELPFDEPLRATAPEPTGDAAAAARSDEEQAAEESRHRRPAPKKRGRASVPSWDEIMFGPTGD